MKNLERRRENSNDGARFAFDIDFLTNEARIFTEAASPESVAQDDNLAISVLVLLRKKCASELNLRAQQRQERRRNGESLNTLRLVFPSQIEIQKPPGGNFFKKSRPILPINEVRRGNRRVCRAVL